MKITKSKNKNIRYIKTGVTGLDKLLGQGIPKKSSVIVAGGTGSGKTNLCLQIINHHASQGKKCYFMSFKEPEESLIEHMNDFKWKPDALISADNLRIKRFLTSEIYYYDKKGGNEIRAMMTKDVDPLLMELEPLSMPNIVEYKPDIIILDSLTAISSTFTGKDQSYRFYIERLFRFFEKIGATTFLVTETVQIPEIFSPTGVEEFIADGVIVIYSIRRKNTRLHAIEVIKMRGIKHQKKIVSMEITDKGIVVHPNKEIFSEVE